MSAAEEKVRLAERDETLERIAAQLGVRAERGKRFAELTSLRVGGSIDWVISPTTEEQAAAIVFELETAGVGWRPLGSGSNVLADDGDHAVVDEAFGGGGQHRVHDPHPGQDRGRDAGL